MIAVDTNVVVRFLVRDDEKQAEVARRRLKQADLRAQAGEGEEERQQEVHRERLDLLLDAPGDLAPRHRGAEDERADRGRLGAGVDRAIVLELRSRGRPAIDRLHDARGTRVCATTRELRVRAVAAPRIVSRSS